MIAGNLFPFQDATKTGESKGFEIKNFFRLFAMERIPALKIFLKLDLVINAILFIYTVCTDGTVSILLVAHYPISLFMAAMNLHYTVSGVTTMFDQKKIRFRGLVRFFLEAIDGIFCEMLLFGYVLFHFPFPFWSYFFVYAVLIVYTLLLNRFGNYPFIDCFV